MKEIWKLVIKINWINKFFFCVEILWEKYGKKYVLKFSKATLFATG